MYTFATWLQDLGTPLWLVKLAIGLEYRARVGLLIAQKAFKIARLNWWLHCWEIGYDRQYYEDRIQDAYVHYSLRRLQQNAQDIGLACTHNHMRERVGDHELAWECADCDYVYGKVS